MNPAVISAIVSGFELLKEVRKSLLERGEWTEAQEAAFSGKVAETFKQPHWEVGAAPAVGGSERPT
jgi:hypothetical protein